MLYKIKLEEISYASLPFASCKRAHCSSRRDFLGRIHRCHLCPAPAPAQEQPEVLSRGPVHEAFAEPVNLQLQAGLVAPERPPPNIGGSARGKAARPAVRLDSGVLVLGRGQERIHLGQRLLARLLRHVCPGCPNNPRSSPRRAHWLSLSECRFQPPCCRPVREARNLPRALRRPSAKSKTKRARFLMIAESPPDSHRGYTP